MSDSQKTSNYTVITVNKKDFLALGKAHYGTDITIRKICQESSNGQRLYLHDANIILELREEVLHNG